MHECCQLPIIQLDKQINLQQLLFGRHLERRRRSFTNDDLVVVVDTNEWVVVHLNWTGSGNRCFPCSNLLLISPGLSTTKW